MMHAALSIAVKDLRQKVRDRSAIILAAIAPLSLAVLFSSALPGSQNTFQAAFVVVDLDGGTVARSLVDGPLSGLAPAGISVEKRATRAEARAMVDDRSASVAIVIPAGFSAAVLAPRATELQVIGSADATLATQVAQSVLAGFASSVEGVQVAVATVIASSGSAPDPATVGRVTQAALAAPAPISTTQSPGSAGTAATMACMIP